MPINKDTIKHVARLSRIDLKPDELEKLSGQLTGILDFIDKLKELDIATIGPTSHILPLKNILRNDEPKTSLPPQEGLAGAPDKEGAFFGVPKVIE